MPRARDGDPGPEEWSEGRHDYDDPGPEERASRRRRRGGGLNGSDRVLDRREQTERVFLAYCLALPDAGEALAWRPPTSTSCFASPEARLRRRGTSRAASAPPPPTSPRGDDALARLVAELVIRAGEAEATPAKLELEALQLDLLPAGPPDRRLPCVRGERVWELLAAQRQSSPRRHPPPADV